MADRDIEQAADLAALCPACGGLGWRFYAPGDEAPCDICGGGGLADELTPALMERDDLDGTAKGRLEWDDVWWQNLHEPGVLAEPDDLNEQETPD